MRRLGLTDAHLTGAHLRLPGHGAEGPTIEIFSYDALEAHPGPRVARPGWGHIAFQVPDVSAAMEAVVAAGGARYGHIITTRTSDGRQVTWCYGTDRTATSSAPGLVGRGRLSGSADGGHRPQRSPDTARLD